MTKEVDKLTRTEIFRNRNHKMDYADDNFIVTERIDTLFNSGGTIRFDMLLLVICKEGILRIDLDGQTIQTEPGEVLFCQPDMPLGNLWQTTNNRVYLVGFSGSLLQEALLKEHTTYEAISYIHNNPMCPLQKWNRYFNEYFTFLLDKIREPSHCYKEDIIYSLLSAMFYEVLSEMRKNCFTNDICLSRKCDSAKQLFYRFMAELKEDGGIHRSLKYYADRLYVTPKYLSAVVKQMSGYPAMQLITSHSMELIKYQLKHSVKSVKEIADMYDFSNQSFFGKYVKASIGMSPIQYRNMHATNIG